MGIYRFNQRAAIQGVLKSWRQQYPGDKDGVAKRLAVLNLNKVAASTVDKIIGNRSWTSLFCSECHEYHSDGVEIDNGDSTVRLCEGCLHKAVGLLDAKRK